MGILTRFFPKLETRSLSEPTVVDLELFGAASTIAGACVSPSTAMRVPAVAAGVKALSEAVSILPLHAYHRAADGSRERDSDAPAFRLLNGDACPWLRGPQLRELMTADAIAYGNAFAMIVRDGEGMPRELHRVHPQAVQIAVDSVTAEPSYRMSSSKGGQRIVPFADMIHIRAPSLLSTDSVTGRSPILEAREAVGLLMQLQGYAAKLFAKGGRPSGLLSFEGNLAEEALLRRKQIWEAQTKGGGTAMLDNSSKFTPLTFSSVDSQFMEIWTLAILEVARVLRVPPAMLMDFKSQTWNNAEFGGQMFLTYSLAPWLSRWEAEVTLKLIAPEDRDSLFVEHLTDALLQADFAGRATAYGQYRSMGVMTANEVRAGLNLPPLPDGNALQNPYTTTTTTKVEPASTGKAKGSKSDA